MDIDSADVQAAVRVKHDGSSSLPDGIAFRETIRMLNYHYEDNPATAVQVVIDIMGLTASDANDFVIHAVDTFNAIYREDRQATVDLACEGKAYDQNPYKVLENMDDTYEDIAEQHFQTTKKRLGDENGARLQLWINSQKHNIMHVKFDHKKLIKSQVVTLMINSLFYAQEGIDKLTCRRGLVLPERGRSTL